MKNVLKAIGKTVKVIFIVFCFFVVSLFFRQQRLPGEWAEDVCERLSSENLVFGCDSLSFGFRHGFHFAGLRVYDRTRRDSLTPFFSTESVSIWPLLRKVRIVGAKMPRLHDRYYYGDPEDSPFVPDGVAESDGHPFALPKLPEFSLELVRPEILGVTPEKVTARVTSDPQKIDVQDIHLDWPDQDHRMWLDGYCTVDLGSRLIIGDVRGTARQEHIRPLLLALDLPSTYRYMGGYPDTGTDGFTEVPGPVPAYCGWKVDLDTREFNLDLDLHPDMGRYNNVRLEHVDGKLGVHVYFTDAYMGYDITVGPLSAIDPNGRYFGGKLTVHGTNGLHYLEFDARSELDKQDALDIVGYLNRGTFDSFKCETPPLLTAKGVFNCDDVNVANNDMGGEFRVDRMGYMGQDLSDVRFDYRLRGSEVEVSRLSAKGVTGGDITGSAVFHVPLIEDDEFYGHGRLDIRNGKLVRVPVFLALTSAMAENVPGIDRLVNQSEARCDFSVSNGVFRTENLVVQGSLFCIRLKGTCDFATDEIDMVAHCTVMKNESTLGKYLIQPVLWPFTKLFTEFHITGPRTAPRLRNTSVKTFKETVGGLTETTEGFFKKVFD